MGSSNREGEAITTELSVLLLAAGASSRLGQSKQLLIWRGQSLLERAIETAKNSGLENIAVVLGANEQAHRDNIKNYSIDIIHNTQWHLGMGNSLKLGIRHILDGNAKGAMVMVCDQPLLSPAHLKNMIRLFDGSKKMIIASSYLQTLGVPALFHRRWFNELLSIGDGEGAKKVIQQNLSQVLSVDFPEGAVDIDFPEDINQLV